jgi:thiamine-phosphate pyrophosphorylase
VIREQLKLYLILETSLLQLPLADFIVQAVEGGVTAIQLRDKLSTAKDRYNTAKAIKPLLEGRDIPFIINNTADIAMAVGAHGVHLGGDDLPPAAIRAKFPDLLVGYSCNSSHDCDIAISSKVDYAGIGPAFHTMSKSDLRPVLGVDGVEEIAKMLGAIPSAAIGGIDERTAPIIKSTDGVCVLSALCKSKTPYDLARDIRACLQG